MSKRLGPVVTVVDESGHRKIPKKIIAKVATAALAVEGVTTGELSILVTRDAKIRALNRKYRGKDEATNVLSFPQKAPLIGDVAISVDYCDRQGKETGSGFRYTFLYYLVHGVLHLLGHDHHQAAEAKRMYRQTEKILEAAGES